jgi:hypothetical protein
MALPTGPKKRKYQNGKIPSFPKPLKKRQDRRKSANEVVAKRMFGKSFPAFGASLGTLFVPATGVINKVNRATSVA